MDALLNVSPGLMIWTIVNFILLLIILIKIGIKPIITSLKAREEFVSQSIENAEKANIQAQKILNESQQQLKEAQAEMLNVIQKGKQQANELIRKATEEANQIRKQKIDEALLEINRSKEQALLDLRKEVASLVILATEKLLKETLDEEKHKKLIEEYINQIPKN